MSLNKDVEKKQIIKHAARELFSRLGYTKTSMADIAQQCRLAKPSLYYYYPNKEAIFNEVVIDEARDFMNQVRQKITPDLPAEEKLVIFFHSIYEGLKIYAAELKDIPEVLCRHLPKGRAIVEKINELFIENLRPLLQAGKQQGLFNYEDEEATLLTLAFMTDFLNLDWIRRYPEKVRDTAVEMMITITLNGLKRG